MFWGQTHKRRFTTGSMWCGRSILSLFPWALGTVSRLPRSTLVLVLCSYYHTHNWCMSQCEFSFFSCARAAVPPPTVTPQRKKETLDGGGSPVRGLARHGDSETRICTRGSVFLIVNSLLCVSVEGSCFWSRVTLE